MKIKTCLLESWKFETSLLLRSSLCAFTWDLKYSIPQISWKIKDNDERTFQTVVSNQISWFRKHTFSGFAAIQLLKDQRLTWSGIFVNIFTLNFATLTFNKAYSRCPVTSCGKIFTKKYIYLAIWKQRKHLSRIVLILLTFFY